MNEPITVNSDTLNLADELRDEEMPERMIDQMVKTAAQASAAIDDALAYIEASNKRIAALEAMKGAR